MNFMSLQCFLIATEEMNFTKAAKRLYISQQSLSTHIAKLEEYYGVQLFDRNFPLTLTKAGEVFFQYAQELLDIKKQSEQALQDVKDFRNTDLKIGISHYRSNAMLPALLPQYHRLYPHVRLNLREGKLAEITEALYKGQVDLIIGYDSKDTANIKSEILYEEKLLLAVPINIFQEHFSPKEQAALLRCKKLPLEKFAHCPFIKMGKNTWIEGVYDSYCKEKAVDMKVVLATTSINAMVSLCVAGLGVIICPDIYLSDRELRKEKRDKLITFELDYTQSDRKIAINFLKNKYQPQAAKEFIKMAKEIFSQPL